MPAPSQTQSHARHPLTKLLGSAGHVRMLRAIVNESAPQSVPQLARVSGLSLPGSRQILATLSELGLVTIHGSGRALLYTLSKAHPLADAIEALFVAEQRRWDELLATLREHLRDQGAIVQDAWLYGSVARGEDRPDSDLDLALIVSSPSGGDRIREDLMPIEDAHGLRISLTALTPEELAALPGDDRWWIDLVRDARILKGSGPEAAKRRATRGAK